MRLALTAIIASLLPVAALAAGSESTTPPAPTETSTTCAKGKVWDAKTKVCLDVKSDLIDNDTRFGAVRELAYAGRLEDAGLALAAMTEGETDRVLTYAGFLARKAGDTMAAFTYYDRALILNPDNILARSYLGQGLAAAGDKAGAQRQLTEIRARGGAGTWAEMALLEAIETGRGFNY